MFPFDDVTIQRDNLMTAVHDDVAVGIYFYSTSHKVCACIFITWWRHQMKKIRVTGPLCGEFTGPGEFPTQRPVMRSFGVFFYLRGRVNTGEACDLRGHQAHYGVIVMDVVTIQWDTLMTVVHDDVAVRIYFYSTSHKLGACIVVVCYSQMETDFRRIHPRRLLSEGLFTLLRTLGTYFTDKIRHPS